MAMPKLSPERSQELLYKIAEIAINHLDVGEILTSENSWESMLSVVDGECYLLAELKRNRGIEDNELDVLFKPFLADAIAGHIGSAKKIVIEWDD